MHIPKPGLKEEEWHLPVQGESVIYLTLFRRDWIKSLIPPPASLRLPVSLPGELVTYPQRPA